jgi:LacI family transcriptional regulator
VTSDAAGLGFSNLSSVSTDDTLAARTVIDHLVQMGHRKIVVIGGNRHDSGIAELRYQGCMQAFRDHGIAFDEMQDYESVRFSFEQGYQAAKNLVAKQREFTAVFAMSDVMAIGAVRALRDEGLRVPEDVSVMGFDGLPLGSFLVPQLSTVTQSVPLLAQRSVEILIDSIENGSAPKRETVPFTVHQRESTRLME